MIKKGNIALTSRRELICSGLAAATLAVTPAKPRAATVEGRFLEYDGLRAKGLPDQRLTIWLPPNYDTSGKRHRVLYMHDAQNLFDPAHSNFNKVWAADKAMLSHAQSDGHEPWIVVGLWSPGIDRYRQYLPLPAYKAAKSSLRAKMDDYAKGQIVSDCYLDWITQVLKPWVDRNLRTHTGALDTAMIGSSMGGLISFYAFLRHPEVFGRVGCVSTHWPAVEPTSIGTTDTELVQIWQEMLQNGLGTAGQRKLWFDHGTETLDKHYAPYQQEIDQFMIEAGWERGKHWVSKVYEGAEHEENAWAKRLPEILNWLIS